MRPTQVAADCSGVATVHCANSGSDIGNDIGNIDYPTRERAVERVVCIRTSEGDYATVAEDGQLGLGNVDHAARFALYRSTYVIGDAGLPSNVPLDGAQATTVAFRSLANGRYLTIQNYCAAAQRRTAAFVATDGNEPIPYYRKRGLTFVVTASAPDVYWNERFTITPQRDGSQIIASHCDDLRDEPNCAAYPMRVASSGAYIDYGNVGVQRLYLEDVDSDSGIDSDPDTYGVAETVTTSETGASNNNTDNNTLTAPIRFTHPGINLSVAQLAAMRDHVRKHEYPWYADWLRVTTTVPNDMACERYQPTFRVGVGRGNPEGSGHIGDWEMSCAAAYFNALRWVVTGEDRYAQTVSHIVDGWSRTLKVIDGRDQILGASLATVKLINAAEIVRYFDGGHASLTDAMFAAFQSMLRNVVYPVVRDGGAPMNANGNWDVAAMVALLAIGVATDDPCIFARGLAMYQSPYCNGSIVNYLTDWGQSVETARDQAHGQLGIGAMIDTCAIAEHQGIDLWSLCGNRLAKAVEWCAQYNLFHGEGELRAVPLAGIFGYFDDISYWDHMEEQGVYRGQLRPIYETALAHWRDVPGVDMTWTARAARAMRPEGLVHFDNLNFSTMTCYNGPAVTEADVEPCVRLRTMIEPWYQRSWAAIRAAGSVPSHVLDPDNGVLPVGYQTETTPSYFAMQADGSLAVTAMREEASVLRVIANDDGTYSLVDAHNSQKALSVGEPLPDGGRALRMTAVLASVGESAADGDCRSPMPDTARFTLHNRGVGPMYLSWNGRLVEIVYDRDAIDSGHTNVFSTQYAPTLRLGTRADSRNTDTQPNNWLLFTYCDQANESTPLAVQTSPTLSASSSTPSIITKEQ